MMNTMPKEISEYMESHDFELWRTGGGCTAWAHTLENGDYILITNEIGVGLFDENGEQKAYWPARSLQHALHAAKWYVMEFYSDDED